MLSIGNKKSNARYYSKENHEKLSGDASEPDKLKHLKKKYQLKLWEDKNYENN